MVAMIPHSRPTLGVEEAAAAAETIMSGQISQGAKVAELEASFAAFLGLKRAVAVITSDKDIWAKEMMIYELGIIPGEEESPWKNGLVTFVSFGIAGLLPLLPYIFNIAIKDTFTTAIIFTGAALFIVGALRTIFTKKNWLLSGLEMLAVGAIAAMSAYLLGYWIDSLT